MATKEYYLGKCVDAAKEAQKKVPWIAGMFLDGNSPYEIGQDVLSRLNLESLEGLSSPAILETTARIAIKGFGNNGNSIKGLLSPDVYKEQVSLKNAENSLKGLQAKGIEQWCEYEIASCLILKKEGCTYKEIRNMINKDVGRNRSAQGIRMKLSKI